MSNFPQFRYTNRDVRRAGEALRGQVFLTEESEEEVKQIFRIANNWRDSHAYPMRRIRYEIIGQIRRTEPTGRTYARLKRMTSIRKKLRIIPQNLNQIQDLGGCRALMPSMEHARSLIQACGENLLHEIHAIDDYIAKPKADGYRSHHTVFKFIPKKVEEDEFEGRRIELQIRTNMQHSWATAVEAVGTFRKEDLKGGSGSLSWLRLFQLMASEIALAENCPELAGAPERKLRIREIRELDKELKATNTLENLRQAFNYVEKYQTNLDPQYFLIRYNNIDSTVSVDAYDSSIAGTMSLDEAEKDQHVNSVLVEADKIEALVEGYPNYFGDVQLFKRSLSNIVNGRQDPEFVLPPQATVPNKPKDTPDYSWLTRNRWRRR